MTLPATLWTKGSENGSHPLTTTFCPRLYSMVHEIVGRINGQFGTLTYVPIYHLDTSLSFTELCALYAVTDVALVTSLRDGMNLVSYEFVACQSDNAGVLVLSEFAGELAGGVPCRHRKYNL